MVIETSFVIWKLRNALRIRDEVITTRRAIAALHDAILRVAQVELTAFLLPETRGPKLKKSLGLYHGKWNGIFEAAGKRCLHWIPTDHG